jgi:hypothetical protein
MGSTRMHRNPRLGVVDADARVHGISNLFVAGSSVFPTSGSANPTLTIVALSLRLAEHLKELLGEELLGAAGFASLERDARTAILRRPLILIRSMARARLRGPVTESITDHDSRRSASG